MAFYSIDTLASEFARERAIMVEAQLIRTLEELLDRVPSDQEVAHHCLRVLSSCQPHLEEFYWKDTFLFGVFTNIYPPSKCHCYFDAPMIKRNSM